MLKKEGKNKVIYNHGPMGYVGFVAFVGAFVFFTHNAQNFGAFLWGFVEALVWPGIVVYHVLSALHA